MATQNKGIIEHFLTEEHTHTHTHTDRTTVYLASQSRQGGAEVMLRRQQARWIRKDSAEGLVMSAALF
jgi:isopenicillin N synthase-like dioxygenase